MSSLRLLHGSSGGMSADYTAPSATSHRPNLKAGTIAFRRPARPPDSKPPTLHRIQGDSLPGNADTVASAAFSGHGWRFESAFPPVPAAAPHSAVPCGAEL